MNTKEINRVDLPQHRFLVTVGIVAFVCNYIWEMLQMPLFTNMGFDDMHAWAFCLLATIGDVIIILFILMLGKWLFGPWRWPEKLNGRRILYLILAGLGIAIITEVIGVGFGWWEYSRRMPVLPYWGTGLAPLVQMLILPAFSLKISLRWTSRMGENFAGQSRFFG